MDTPKPPEDSDLGFILRTHLVDYGEAGESYNRSAKTELAALRRDSATLAKLRERLEERECKNNNPVAEYVARHSPATQYARSLLAEFFPEPSDAQT